VTKFCPDPSLVTGNLENPIVMQHQFFSLQKRSKMRRHFVIFYRAASVIILVIDDLVVEPGSIIKTSHCSCGYFVAILVLSKTRNNCWQMSYLAYPSIFQKKLLPGYKVILLVLKKACFFFGQIQFLVFRPQKCIPL
jgi:hypothetical protein